MPFKKGDLVVFNPQTVKDIGFDPSKELGSGPFQVVETRKKSPAPIVRLKGVKYPCSGKLRPISSVWFIRA
jgi:hypothetical protein